ncbi:hypothetical protein Moror_13821 [Moniliophthora roreri MCA 2997]|uniref:Uncharacterized protein n=1 Tax=Moniliophthora roreri (strain MCA 2997) TaxID=1381753 RepID=V2YTT3_MONRO|nr:hypothetical protein Moror_13821 [Moniliophthora roreri MCA 2997]
MLGISGTASRPRPPAQMRRTSSMKTANTSPPPPYASSFVFPSNPRKSPLETRATLLGSPVSASLQMVTQDIQGSGSAPRNHDEMMEWLKEKSHNELSELLLRADEVIKQRESDLDRTSSLCKSLYEDNSSLQSKHKALLSRIPSTPSRQASTDSPLPSPAPSPHRPSPSVESPTHSPSISRRCFDQDPFLYQAPRTVPHKYGGRHIRRISVTPYDISLLTDQNTELLLKVEKLEAESASHELAGRKTLKKMEKEINALRDELEAVRAKEAQNALRAKEEEEAALHRKKGKAKMRMMRSKSGPVHFGQRETDPFGQTVKDFAPAGPLSSLFNRSAKNAPSHTPISESQEEDSSDTDPHTPTSTTNLEDQQREFIAQVLSKMAELEETNSRLESQQADTAAKLLAIQKETESLGRLYEGIDDEVEIVQGEPSPEIESAVSEGHSSDDTRPSKPKDSTIRFRSFRRTLEGLGAPPKFNEGNGIVSASSTSRMHVHKPRRSVVGLFEAPESAPSLESSSTRHPAPVSSSDALEAWANRSGLVSPALSTLSGFSLSFNPFDSMSPSAPNPAIGGNTLSNELGGNEWLQDGPSDHLRTSSLYDFNMLSGQADFAPSPSPSPVDFSKVGRTLFPTAQPSEDLDMDMDAPRTPMRKDSALQLNLEPPTPESDGQKSPAQKQTARYRKMSQTVRARTARWVDGRFTDSVLGSPSSPSGTVRSKQRAYVQDKFEEIKVKETPTATLKTFLTTDSESESSVVSTKTKKSAASESRPIPRRIASALDLMVEKITRQSVSGSESNSPRVRTASVGKTKNDEANRSVEVYVAPAPPHKEKKSAGFGDIVLEVWLWLQFAVIILVFLWAMAKRGPKSVLGDVQARQRSSVREL